MSAAPFAYELIELDAPRLGLIALQADETIEGDLRRLLPGRVDFMVSRVPSGAEVTAETLAEMEGHLAHAAALLPAAARFDAIGYGCTSGTARIGAQNVAARIAGAINTAAVTDPLSGLIAACAHLGIRRLALLSPYVAEVSEGLRQALGQAGIATPVFGSFEVSAEASVVRISQASIAAAAAGLMRAAEVDALFLSCTNLRALDLIVPLETEFDRPVLSSNQVLAWHMMRLAGVAPPADAPGRLFLS
jgi:maleate isomerase